MFHKKTFPLCPGCICMKFLPGGKEGRLIYEPPSSPPAKEFGAFFRFKVQGSQIAVKSGNL